MRLALSVLLTFFSLYSFNARAESVEITRVVPSGAQAQTTRQITLTFNQKMVPLGKMSRTAKELGISVTPALRCQWRWLDPSTLACELAEADTLKKATRYTLTLQAGLKSQGGQRLEKAFTHSFSTETPKHTYARFETWRSPGMPQITLSFNQPVTRASLEKVVSFSVKGQVIKVRALKEQGSEESPDDEAITKITQKSKALPATGQYWLVEPLSELPFSSSISLVTAAGLESELGPLKGTGERIVAFDTFPAFRFLGVNCSDQKDQPIRIRKSGGTEKCSPLRGVSLVFTAPVTIEAVRASFKSTPAFSKPSDADDVWAESYSNASLSQPHRSGQEYTVALPSFLRARATYRLQAQQLKDMFDRKVSQSIDFTFATDARAPDLTVPHLTGILEKEEKTDIPLYVTNLESVSMNYTSLSHKGVKTNQTKVIAPSKVLDVAYALPMEARTMIDAKSGAISGTFSTTPATNPNAGRSFFIEITPYHVMAKVGHYNTLVWVTDMRTGLPVQGAAVTIERSGASENRRELTDLKELARAQTDDKGIAQLPGEVEFATNAGGKSPGRYRSYHGKESFAVRVVKGEDLALLPLDYDFVVEGFRINSSVYPTRMNKWGHMRAWGSTAQGVYRLGDTVQYKIYVRNHNGVAFDPAPKTSYSLIVRDPTGKETLTLENLSLNEFGALHGEFKVAENSPVGFYEFELKSNFAEISFSPMRVLVADFTPIPFKVDTNLNGDFFRSGDTLKTETVASMHAGGPYTDAAVRVTGLFRPELYLSKNPKTQDFVFDEWKNINESQLFQTEASVNQAGRHEQATLIEKLPATYGTITVESAVSDDRGKRVVGTAAAIYDGLDRRVGLRPTSWLLRKGEPAKYEYVVINYKGEPVAGTPVEINVEWQETKLAKVKGAGNAYLSQYETNWVSEHKCNGVSTTAVSACSFSPKQPGSYRLTASIKDSKGREHIVTQQTWSAGKGQVVWQQENEFNLPVVPEKTSYKPGDKAKFLVQNPLPGALALITVERYGVMRSWTQKLDDGAAVVEVPILPDDVPGFYLSIALVSPRVNSSEPLGQVDLGKPTFRMALLQVDVKDPYKEIVIKAKPDKDVYRPRDKVTVSIEANVKNPGQKEPMEFAVAVLDEAVLSLIQGGTKYYDPYSGMYSLDGLDVATYTLLTRIVGRQKFEKKGASHGGGGGLADDMQMRSLFKFVSYWNPSLKPDANGRAKFDFTLPDNLTGWRIIVMAVTPSDRMGLGQARFQVNKPTELRPVMPNQVTEGDSFRSGFSLMNRTDKPRKIEVVIEAGGTIQGEKKQLKQSLDMKARERRSIFLDLKTSSVKQDRNTSRGAVTFDVRAGDEFDKDGLKYEVPVLKRRSLEVAASYGTTIDALSKEALLIPKDIHADVGSITVTAAPSVIGNIEGAFRYMRDYPYMCWEQKLSKGVMAAHFKALASYVPGIAWAGAETIPQATLEQAANHQTPSGGMAFYDAREEYVSPYLSAYTAVAFIWMRDAGHKVPTDVEKKLHGFLKGMLKNRIVPTFYDEGMEATVRALALYALARAKVVDHTEVKRYFSAMPKMSLFGKAHYLMAAIETGKTDKEQAATVEKILQQGNQTSGKFMFNEKWEAGWGRILATPIRDNCAVLSGISRYARTAAGLKSVGDVPFRLVRSLTQSRGTRDHFENTQENMFCMQAMIDYSRQFEATPPNFKVTASLGPASLTAATPRKTFGSASFTKVTDPMQTFELPLNSADRGQKTEVQIEKKGEGRLYYATRLSYSPLDEKADAVNSGVDVRREYHVERAGKWSMLGAKAEVKRGELVRVDLYVSLPAARNYLVVNDPIPGGFEAVNRDLANESEVDAKKADFKPSGGSLFFRFRDWIDFQASLWSFYHQEIRHESVRYYSEYLAPGNYRLSFTMQAIAAGQFSAQPTLVEEMYDPDVFGKSKPQIFMVKE